MTESRENVESNMMIRITTLDITHQHMESESSRSNSRRRRYRPRMGILRRLLGCLPHVTPAFLSSYRKKKKKIESNPRLRYILDRLIISVIRKVEEAENSTTNLSPVKKTTKNLNQSIPCEKVSTLKTIDLVQECCEDGVDDVNEDLEKVETTKKKGEITGGDEGYDPTRMTKQHPNVVFHDSKENMGKNPESKSKNILESRECPICWEPYQVGQQICWPPNKRCNHAFHTECMVVWLMKKDDCPMCRSNYLLIDP